MKNKLIAMLVTATLLGGVGASAYATIGQGAKNEVAQTQATKGYQDEILQANSDSNIKATELCSPQIKKVVKEDSKDSSNKITYKKEKVSNNAKSGESKASKNVEKKKEATNTTNNQEKTGSSSNKKTVSDNKNTSSNKGGQVSTASDKFMAQVEQKIFEKVNAERSKAGVPALSYNKTMEKYARIKSQDMGDRGYFDHKDPEGNLITAKMKKDGVSYRAWGENIAYIGGVSDADALANQFMTNWMNSSGHRKNILSSNFSGIGVGVYKAGNKVYATQEFYK